MSSPDYEDKCPWGSRSLYLMALLSQTIGTSVFSSLPNTAIATGASGYMIGLVLVFLFMGIPLLYMEFIVSQFTARNCLGVWRIRACLSHIGYIQFSWQIFLLVYNHTITAFVIHYFLITFEDPIPYFMCGPWSTNGCNIAVDNYTVHQDCLKLKISLSHCEHLYSTYPEYQYWRYFILGGNKKYYYIAWRVCLASGLACTIMYLSCFKRKESVKWFIYFFVAYSSLGYSLLLIGAMMQKGVVLNFENAFDTNFSLFKSNCRVSDIMLQVLYMLNIGTGISFNLGSSTSFRAPCYSNVVITVVVCAMFTVLIISTISMMTCPYAFEYISLPTSIMNLRLSFIFEKTPRLVKEFDHKSFWLIIVFSSNSILGLSTTVIILLCLLETFAANFTTVDKYPGLVTFAATIIVFFISTPLLGNSGIYTVYEFKRYVSFINIFIGILESLVFVVWYGLDKFSEDVHFMQGIQPNAFMKIAWVASSAVMAYVFVNEFYILSMTPVTSIGEIMGWWTLLALVLLIVLTTVVKLVVAASKNNFLEAIRVDPLWGPRNVILLRSRAMFSAQAMTKEYMYRQYHLQAGILARQKASNVRRERDV